MQHLICSDKKKFGFHCKRDGKGVGCLSRGVQDARCVQNISLAAECRMDGWAQEKKGTPDGVFHCFGAGEDDDLD